MAKIRYTGPEGLVRRDDRALKQGEVLTIPDGEFDDHMALGRGTHAVTGADLPGFFECVEAPKPKPVADDSTHTNPPAAAGDVKE